MFLSSYHFIELTTQCWRKNEAWHSARPSCAIFMNDISNQLILSTCKNLLCAVFNFAFPMFSGDFYLRNNAVVFVKRETTAGKCEHLLSACQITVRCILHNHTPFFISANFFCIVNISSRNRAASIKSRSLAAFSISFLIFAMAFSICGTV